MAKNAKEYFLMHKDIRVCLMEVTDEGSASKTGLFFHKQCIG